MSAIEPSLQGEYRVFYGDAQDDIEYGKVSLEYDEVALLHQQTWISACVIHIDMEIIFSV